jgi:16S rRNA (uracil1498-N3)-methyltransferase
MAEEDPMSKPPRFFISPAQAQGSVVAITGEDLRHIRTVLRKRPDDLLTLLDGQGMEYTARIAEVRKDEIVTEIIERTRRELTRPRIILGQGFPKSDKMDWIVQKATELGVASIVPIITERTVMKVKDEGKRVSRWEKIAREAAMQSNRPDIPEIGAVRTFDDFLGTLASGPRTLLIIPWEEGTTPIKRVLRSLGEWESVVVLIGPEGGFSEDETGLARTRGFQPVSLGPRILRTETAAVASLSMIGYELS